LDAAAEVARDLVQSLMARQSLGASPWLLNVNVPCLPKASLKSLKVCRLGRRHPAERVITQQNPRGETMYWIGSAGPAKDDVDGTDFHATFTGHVSLTPLQVDLTDHTALANWVNVAQAVQGA